MISDIEVESPCYRNGDGNKRKEGEAEQGGVFLEENLVASMMHSGRHDPCSSIGVFEYY